MQEISLEQLKKLLPGKLQESDSEIADDVSFKALCREYESIREQNPDVRRAYDIFTRRILSRYKPIKFVGDGSSRAAFACVGGKCIKVAKSEAGIAQNKQENKTTAKHWWKRSYDCFAKTYDHSDDYALLLSECCAHIDNEDHLTEAFGMDGEKTLTAVIWAIAEEKSHDVKKSATSLRAKCTTWQKSGGSINGIQLNDKNIETAERATEWLESLSDRRSLTPGKKSFLQITDFWKKHGIKELLPGDVGSCRNWGYTIRNGELAPVMLDVGFSQKIANIFYEDANMNNESRLINYWAHMLDESQPIDLQTIKGSMTQAINDQVMNELEGCKTVQQVYDLVKNAFDANDIDTEASRRLLYHIQRSHSVVNAIMTVHNSRMAGMNLGVNGPRRRRTYEDDCADGVCEEKHSMHGPAWARKTGGVDEIADMREKLANGVVEFTFWKHGEEGQGEVQRRAVGTTSEQVMPVSARRELDPNYDENVASYERRSGFIIWFWDLEKDAARCFNTNRFDEITNYVPTTTRYNDEDRIGPIEVNKFVDDFDMP